MNGTGEKLTKLELMIEEHKDGFGRQEHKTALFLMTHQDEILSLSLSDIALQASVSQPTVVRFCKKLGFNGLKDFKIFFQNGNERLQPNSGPAGWEDDDRMIFNKVFTNSLTALERTFKATDWRKAAALSDLITNASNITVLGIGGSALAASYMASEIMRLRKKAASITDTYTIGHLNTEFEKDDLLVFISRSGENPPLLSIAERARENEASIALLTTCEQSSLASLSDCTVAIREQQYFQDDGNSYSRISQISMICCIYIMSAIRLGRRSGDFRDNYQGITNYQ